MSDKPPHLPSVLYAFDNIIDGYFPLQVSLTQMMDRQQTRYAIFNLSHAPIMRIPGLPHDAPVPLSIFNGSIGLIRSMLIELDRRDGPVQLRGLGCWAWANESTKEDTLDPMTRLAEPAYLWGLMSRSEQQNTAPTRSYFSNKNRQIRYLLEEYEKFDALRVESWILKAQGAGQLMRHIRP